MNSPRRKSIPLLVLCVAGLIAAVAAWGIYTSDSATKARERDARLAAAGGNTLAAHTPTLTVSTVTAVLEPAAEVVSLAGVLEPVRATWVAAEVAGSVVEVPAAEHAPVAAGDVLVKIDPALPEAELIRAEASHRLARSERQRQESLGQRSVASASELDRAVAEERRAFAAVLEARTRVAHTRIVAPFDGLVNSLDLDPGAYVQPGTPIAEVLDVSSVEVSVPVSDRQVRAVAVGDSVNVRVDALGNEIVSGRIARVGGAPQADTQRYPVVVELANPDGELLPGMLAHVELRVGSDPAVRIPARAVVSEFELDYVFVIEGEDVVRRARVATRPVPFRPEQVEILSGLEPGARVVVSSIAQLRDGMRVIAP